MNDTLLKSYCRSFNGGKSRFAQICDGALSALLLVIVLRLFLLRRLNNGIAAILTAIFITASILLAANLLRNMRFKAHIKKLRAETAESILQRRLLVSPEVDDIILNIQAASADAEGIYLVRTERKVAFDEICPLIRDALERNVRRMVLYSVSEAEPEAEAAMRAIGNPAIEFRRLDSIPELRYRLSPDETEIDAAIEAAFPPPERLSVGTRLKRAASRLRTEKRASRYLFTGLGLYALSCFSTYRFYIRLAASAALLAAVLFFVRRRAALPRSGGKSSDGTE